nr:hypothetical protein [Tanacetum cinerariifolium]
TPKKARKWKKPASPSKKQTLVTTEEPAKIPAARSQPTSVQNRDTLGVEYESLGFSDDDQQGDDERTESDDVKSVDLNKTDDEEETQEDDFVHTTDDHLKDVELANEGKGDEEMTNADKVNVELKEVNQEVASA